MNTKPQSSYIPADTIDKYLSDNRDRYVEQSKATRNGVVAPLPPAPLGLQAPPQ